MNVSTTRKADVVKYLVVLAVVGFGLVGAVSTPALAGHEDAGSMEASPHCGDGNGNMPAVCLCYDAADAAEPLRIFFTILSVLGPVFGSLFYVGLSVAGAAQLKDEYSEQRRRVLILGFSVPIAIAFLNTIGNKLVAKQDLNCFFP